MSLESAPSNVSPPARWASKAFDEGHRPRHVALCQRHLGPAGRCVVPRAMADLRGHGSRPFEGSRGGLMVPERQFGLAEAVQRSGLEVRAPARATASLHRGAALRQAPCGVALPQRELRQVCRADRIPSDASRSRGRSSTPLPGGVGPARTRRTRASRRRRCRARSSRPACHRVRARSAGPAGRAQPGDLVVLHLGDERQRVQERTPSTRRSPRARASARPLRASALPAARSPSAASASASSRCASSRDSSSPARVGQRHGLPGCGFLAAVVGRAQPELAAPL